MSKSTKSAGSSESTAPRSSASKSSKPKRNGKDQEAVARRAYEIYEMRTRGGHHGSAEDDWLEAERQLRPGATAKRTPIRRVGKKKDEED